MKMEDGSNFNLLLVTSTNKVSPALSKLGRGGGGGGKEPN